MEGKKLALAPVTGVVSGAGGAVTVDFLVEEMTRPGVTAVLAVVTGVTTETGFVVTTLAGGVGCFARVDLATFGLGLVGVDLIGLAAFSGDLAVFADVLGAAADLVADFVGVGAGLMGLAGRLLPSLAALSTGLVVFGVAGFAIGLAADLTTGFFELATLAVSLTVGFGADFVAFLAAALAGVLAFFTALFAAPWLAVLLAVLVAAFMLGLLASMDGCPEESVG